MADPNVSNQSAHLQQEVVSAAGLAEDAVEDSEAVEEGEEISVDAAVSTREAASATEAGSMTEVVSVIEAEGLAIEAIAVVSEVAMAEATVEAHQEASVAVAMTLVEEAEVSADHLAVEVSDITAMDLTVHPTVHPTVSARLQDHHQECTVGMVDRDKISNVKTWVDTTTGTPKGLDTRSKQRLLVKVRLRYTFPAFHFSFWVFAFTHPDNEVTANRVCKIG